MVTDASEWRKIAIHKYNVYFKPSYGFHMFTCRILFPEFTCRQNISPNFTYTYRKFILILHALRTFSRYFTCTYRSVPYFYMHSQNISLFLHALTGHFLIFTCTHKTFPYFYMHSQDISLYLKRTFFILLHKLPIFICTHRIFLTCTDDHRIFFSNKTSRQDNLIFFACLKENFPNTLHAK